MQWLFHVSRRDWDAAVFAAQEEFLTYFDQESLAGLLRALAPTEETPLDDIVNYLEVVPATVEGIKTVQSHWSWLRMITRGHWDDAVKAARDQLGWQACDREWLKRALQMMTGTTGEPDHANAPFNWLLAGNDQGEYMKIARNVSLMQYRNVQYKSFEYLLRSTQLERDTENKTILQGLVKGVEAPVTIVYPFSADLIKDMHAMGIKVADALVNEGVVIVGGDTGVYATNYAGSLRELNKAGLTHSVMGGMKIRFDGKVVDRVLHNHLSGAGKIVVFGFTSDEFEFVKKNFERISGKRFVHHQGQEAQEERPGGGQNVVPASGDRCEIALQNDGVLPKYFSFGSPVEAEQQLRSWGLLNGDTILPGIEFQKYYDETRVYMQSMAKAARDQGISPEPSQHGQLVFNVQVGGALRSEDLCAIIGITPAKDAIPSGVNAVHPLEELRAGGSCRYIQSADLLYFYGTRIGDAGVFNLLFISAQKDLSVKDASGTVTRPGSGKKVHVKPAPGTDPAKLVDVLHQAGWSASLDSERSSFYSSAEFAPRGSSSRLEAPSSRPEVTPRS
ncbi:hypothetical protein JHN49_28275 [Streptomyces sp. MBT57]|nr:hypothetical protein [Streptomyces sp. MBT57]